MLSLQKDETFTGFKARFYAAFPDLRVFDCQDYNLLKVALDGLKVNYALKGSRWNFIFRPVLIQRLILLLRRSLKKPGKIAGNSAIHLLLDNGKITTDGNGNQVSYYFGKIENFLGENRCFTLFQKETRLQKKNSQSVLHVWNAYRDQDYDTDEIRMIWELRRKYREFKNVGALDATDKQNLRTAFTKFFFEYRVFNRYFSSTTYTECFFDEHYHREGFILAMKRHGIKATELQHGLIAEQDIFYIFPPEVSAVRQKALFADRMLCYGEYWINVLRKGAEYTGGQLQLIGLYQYSTAEAPEQDKKLLNDFLNGHDFILVTTQTFLHKQFIAYVNWLHSNLLARGQEVKIVVKPHPSEKREVYQSLEQLPNCLVTNVNTEYLLSKCTNHVSIYSTTLYDALKYTCGNFALQEDACADYVQKIVADGIAQPLEYNENPLDADTTNRTTADPSHFFANFDLYKQNLIR